MSKTPALGSIPIARPSLGDEEAEAVRRVLASRWVGQGPEVEAFEQEFSQFVGAQHACATSSGTSALFLALKAVGIGEGDEVVAPSHSFVATANVIRMLGATPAFVDIDPATFNLDPDRIEEVLTPRTRAILAVHQLGMPQDMEQICQIASRHGLEVVEDAACAVGSELRREQRWERVGRPHGRIACFSFHPRKIMTTGEGGMVTTNDEELDRRCRTWRQHGLTVARPSAGLGSGGQPARFEELGYNFRLSDLQAAVGRVQLGRVPEMVAQRRRLAQEYGSILTDLERVRLPREPGWARTNWQSYCVVLDEGVSAERVRQEMQRAGVTVLGGVLCAHREPVYQREPWTCGRRRGQDCDCQPGHCERLRHSEWAQDHGLMLPLFCDMGERDVRRVGEALKRALECSTR